MSRARIVVVEDEHPIRRGVVDALSATGYHVSEAADGQHGLKEALRPEIDLVLLDLLLPKRDGLSVLTEIRKTRPTLPVIVLTARGSEEDRVKGLKMGADDYVVKPFSARELLARVEAILRRVLRPTKAKLAKLGRATIDLDRREILWGSSHRCELSETEGEILRFLLQHRHRAVSRDEILRSIWGIETEGLETRTVDMHVARLRAKLKDPNRKTPLEAILTVRSRGYVAGPDLIPIENGEVQERSAC